MQRNQKLRELLAQSVAHLRTCKCRSKLLTPFYDKFHESIDAALSESQPDPKPNDSRPVWELVIEDMQARDKLGRERYGVPLQAGNGRDALRDLYEEILDAAVYARQALAERDGR